MFINNYSDKEVEIFDNTGKVSKKCKWANIKKIVRRKLDMITIASSLDDLRSPPSNHLEKLKGDLENFYSIRVNNQWRIIFKINKCNQVIKLSIVDYH